MAYSGCDEVVQALLEHSPAITLDALDDKSHSPLWWAVRGGHMAVVRRLLGHGADINAAVSSMGNKEGREEECGTALFMAADHGDSEMFMLLLEHGADVNVSNGVWSLLHRLLHHRKDIQALIPHILARGADPNCRDDYLQTPLHHTARDHDLKTARLLLEAGADLEARTEGGLTPLGYAVMSSRYKMATLLLEHGAQVETADQYENRPLHTIAAKAAHDRASFRILELLLTKGCANATATNYFNQTALHCALQAAGIGGSSDGDSTDGSGDSDEDDSDEDDGDEDDSDEDDSDEDDSDEGDSDEDDSDSGDSDSGSEGDIAAGLEEVVRLLLKHGANPVIRDQNGKSPFDILRGLDRTRNLVLEELLKHTESITITKEKPYIRYL